MFWKVMVEITVKPPLLWQLVIKCDMWHTCSATSCRHSSGIITPVKLSKEKGSILATWLRWGKGKCACGKLIDQVNSLISFVIVIAYVCACVCGWVKGRESPAKRASCLHYYKFEGYWGHTFLTWGKTAFHYKASGRSHQVISFTRRLRWSILGGEPPEGLPAFILLLD